MCTHVRSSIYFTVDQEIGVINILIMSPHPSKMEGGHIYYFGADPVSVGIVATLCCVQGIMN